jgi:putative ABC transport system substrate-binding protein
MAGRRLALVVVLALLAAPFAVRAQPGKAARIGYLSGNPPSDTKEAFDGFRGKLREIGYVERQNLTIEARYADGRYEKLPALAEELVKLKVDVIFAYGTPAASAAKKATSTIPLVFGVVSDPLAAGLVASLNRPGGNVTGVTPNNPELSAKRVSLLKEAVPGATRIAVLANPDFPATSGMLAETRLGARTLGVELQIVEARTPAELAPAFAAMSKTKAKAVIVLADAMFIAQRQRIAALAAAERLPAIYHLRHFVDAGGLVSYGADYSELFQQGAVLVDRILKGAKPADIAVEQPWRYALVVNLKTAKTLGLNIPQSLLLRADQVIR